MFAQGQYSVPADSGAGSPQNTYYVVGRADWNITPTTQLYGRYALEKGNLFTGTVTNSPYDGYDSGQSTTNNSFLLSLIHTFSPKLTSQSKIVFNRLNLLQPLGSNPVGPTLYMNSVSAPKIEGNLIAMPGYSPFTPGNAIPFGGHKTLSRLTRISARSMGVIRSVSAATTLTSETTGVLAPMRKLLNPSAPPTSVQALKTS